MRQDLADGLEKHHEAIQPMVQVHTYASKAGSQIRERGQGASAFACTDVLLCGDSRGPMGDVKDQIAGAWCPCGLNSMLRRKGTGKCGTDSW